MKVTASNFWLARAVRAITRWHFMPQNLREKICRFLFKPNSLEPFPFEVPLHNIIYKGDLSTYQDWRIFFLGSFERETINLLTHIVRSNPSSVFLDIGANSGLFSAALSAYCTKVHAFEPYPPLQALLSGLLQRNDITNVQVHPVGLGHKSEIMPYYPPSGANIGVGSFIREHQGDEKILGVNLRIERGDDYLSTDLGAVTAVKIDTEGYEGFVLRGLQNTLEKNRPMIVCEMSATTASTVSSGEEFAGLFPMKYDFYLVSDHTTCPAWYLAQLKPSQLLNSFGNILACPEEKRSLIAASVLANRS
jgi:FkbM family methyltransferase